MSLYQTEQRQAKTTRILVYPNITFAKDLEKDSYIQVIKKQITLLNEIRDDLWFYLILPKEVPSLVFDNVTQLIVYLPTHSPTMRAHFDTEAIKKVLPREYDFDLVMCHLPEHAYDLKNVLYNKTQHVPKFFGYAHWFDFKEVVNWPMDSFNKSMIGLLEYDKCYINTQHQKEMVLKQAEEIFNSDTLYKLSNILEVQHIGVDGKDIVLDINEKTFKKIVFNHRPETYKNYKDFLELMDKLYEQRQDFKVWVPLASKPDREYITVEKGHKDFYYKKLQECRVGFSPKQTYGGWSVATTDGMMNGVPYIMYGDLYYEELNEDADFFTNHVIAIDLLNKYLDNIEYRNEMADQALGCVINDLVYKDEIEKMSDYIDQIVEKLPWVSQTEKVDEIIEWIKKEKVISKKNLIDRLNWGVGIKFTQYRRRLLTNPNIYDTISEYPNYCWSEK